jgi:predicted nucleic acid-binding protein
MGDYSTRCVVDTSIIIDLHIAGIITHLFKLPYDFIAPDVIIAELLEPDGALLIELGVRQETLEGDQIIEVLQLRRDFNRPSVNDLFALVLARALKAILLTNDRSLRIAAEHKGMIAHGILWILDEMVRLEVISPPEAADALRTMLEKGSRLPLDECNKRLQKWQSSPST